MSNDNLGPIAGMPCEYRRREFYPNGYGASIVCHAGSYGGRDGLFEVAVLRGTGDGDCRIAYDTGLTSDVWGYLEPRELAGVLGQIMALPPDGPLPGGPMHLASDDAFDENGRPV